MATQPQFRTSFAREALRMAFETLRAQKMRSALTVVGVVIGITSIVGMTSLIRGFDESLRKSIEQLGPKTVFVAKFSGLSLSTGAGFLDLLKRPNLSIEDAKALERASSVARVDVVIGRGPGGIQERIVYGGQRTKNVMIFGGSSTFAEVSAIPILYGRQISDYEVEHRRNVVVLGWTPYQALFPLIDPVGKQVRIRGQRYTVVGVFGKAPNVAAVNVGQDDFVLVPYSTHQKHFGGRGIVIRGLRHVDLMIGVVPREEVDRDTVMADVERIMRVRHHLRLEEPNDFDLITQDAVLGLWDQVSGATFLALVVISSIALLVGGIGVMAIMTISVTERTREIGVRKALGARRREILWQFLLEATALTLLGGLFGILCGSAIGLGVHYLSGFPVSLPWWSFAIGIAFSASVGIAFGMIPAIRASRLDPIEALRYE